MLEANSTSLFAESALVGDDLRIIIGTLTLLWAIGRLYLCMGFIKG